MAPLEYCLWNNFENRNQQHVCLIFYKTNHILVDAINSQSTLRAFHRKKLITRKPKKTIWKILRVAVPKFISETYWFASHV